MQSYWTVQKVWQEGRDDAPMPLDCYTPRNPAMPWLAAADAPQDFEDRQYAADWIAHGARSTGLTGVTRSAAQVSNMEIVHSTQPQRTPPTSLASYLRMEHERTESQKAMDSALMNAAMLLSFAERYCSHWPEVQDYMNLANRVLVPTDKWATTTQRVLDRIEALRKELT